MKTIFITYAVKEELIELKSTDYKIIYIETGIGKTKSTYYLTQKILEEKPDFILNIGTAGTMQHQVGDVFIATNFIDRDYATLELPGIQYEIDGLQLIKNHSKLNNWISEYTQKGICSTGDTFVKELSSVSCDFVDMEAYSQAYVCNELNIPFFSIKYITDIVGQNSIKHWENKLADARKTLSEWFAEHDLLNIIID